MATVLIIEDDINMAELLKERLEHKGYNTVVAYSAIKGLKEMHESKPDAITLDIHLPDMSGVDVLRLLKMDKEKAATPILFLTVVILVSHFIIPSVIIPWSFRRFIKSSDLSSLPITEHNQGTAPRAFTFRATFDAPPRRFSRLVIDTTGIGASGEIRSTLPHR